MELPTVLMGDQVYAALKMLGIRRDDCGQVREVHVGPHGVVVTMYRLNDQGKKYVDGKGDIVTETISVAIRWGSTACTCPDATRLSDTEPRSMRDPACPIHGEVG